jgi:hypothetical protein
MTWVTAQQFEVRSCGAIVFTAENKGILFVHDILFYLFCACFIYLLLFLHFNSKFGQVVDSMLSTQAVVNILQTIGD